MTYPTEPVLALPLSAIRVLLYGDERLEGLQPLTKTFGDTAKVIVIPMSIGVLLKEWDPEEQFWHIEFPQVSPDLYPIPTAEVWLPSEWLESNARRQRRRAQSHQERKENNLRSERLAELIHAIRPQFKAPDDFIREIAVAVLDNYRKTDLTKVLTAINIAELLTRFNQEDKEERNHNE